MILHPFYFNSRFIEISLLIVFGGIVKRNIT